MLSCRHAWSRKQKSLIVAGAVVALAASGTLIYVFERYYRGPSDRALVGTWQLEDGCVDCTHLITLEPIHNVIGFSDGLGHENLLDYHGRWYAGGELLVIHYDNSEEAQSIVIRIIDIAPDTIRVRWNGREMRLTRSRRAPPREIFL
jgi:hypothetical protein